MRSTSARISLTRSAIGSVEPFVIRSKRCCEGLSGRTVRAIR